MSRINPEGQLTRKERLVTVIAIVAAVLVHVVALSGWGRIFRWTQEEQKKERHMVVRRVRETALPRETPPEPSRPRGATVGTQGKAGVAEQPASPPPPSPKVRERGPEQKPEPPPPMEQEPQEQKPDQTKAPEHRDNSVSVMTDLPAASFVVTGPAEYRGSGTFWVRKGVAPGVYSITFSPVPGYATPAGQSRELGATGQIVFVGKYRRSTEIIVDSNETGAHFTIFRPDGRPLELSRPGRTLIEDLPPGNYTAVFKDVPGHITPSPISRSLGPGGKLSFYGEYRDGPGGGGGGSGQSASAGAGAGSGSRGAGGGAQGERGAGRGGKAPAAPGGAPEGGLDRRVQLVVRSYPPTDIEESYQPIAYPEIIIHKSNFQQGWCQVYLVLTVNEDGEVAAVGIERPRSEDRPQYETLIRAVEAAARSWDYDKVAAEVHVDVRFYVE